MKDLTCRHGKSDNRSMTTPSQSAFGLSLDVSSFITKCSSAQDARRLPSGAIVGDRNGGLTFTDDVASVLESRSLSGWMEVEPVPGEPWTIIVLNR
jgi:hypothetical protein